LIKHPELHQVNLLAITVNGVGAILFAIFICAILILSQTAALPLMVGIFYTISGLIMGYYCTRNIRQMFNRAQQSIDAFKKTLENKQKLGQ